MESLYIFIKNASISQQGGNHQISSKWTVVGTFL